MAAVVAVADVADNDVACHKPCVFNIQWHAKYGQINIKEFYFFYYNSALGV